MWHDHMTSTEIIDDCRSRDVWLFAGIDGKLRYDAPCGAVSPWLAAELSSHAAEVLELLGSREQGGTRDSHRPVVVEHAGVQPASDGPACKRCGSSGTVMVTGTWGPHRGRINCVRCRGFISWARTPDHLLGESWIMPIGKHKGRSLDEIAETDLRYLKWAALELNQPRIRGRIACFLEHMEACPPSP